MFAFMRPRTLAVLLVLPLVACDAGRSFSGSAAPTFLAAGAGFGLTGSAIEGRYAHVATRLADGRVLVAGGIAATTGLRTTELYDPATGTWSSTGAMNFERFGDAYAALPGGRVLVVGGVRFLQNCATVPFANSSEIYDPAAGTWALTPGGLIQGRTAAIAVPLADGRVLLAGGGSRCGVVFNSAEIFNPATGRWTPTGSMNVARQNPAAVRLPDGRVLVAGGVAGGSFASLASAEIFNPVTGTWTLTGSMHDPRMWVFDDMTAAGFLVPLADGRVLTAGGLNRCAASGCDVAFLRSAELYDPATGSWTVTGSLTQGRWRHQMALLADGRVLVAGGRQGATILGSAEIYDPATGAFTPAGNLVTARQDFTATPLADKRVLLAEGQGTAGILRSAEVFPSNQAPVADAGAATAAGDEGAVLAFDGSASADPDGDALTYSWTFGDGTPATTGSAASHAYADNGTYTVVLTVSDGSLSSDDTVAVQISNVAPVVGDLGSAEILPGETYAAAGSFVDPGADTWTATVDYGDGSGVQPLPLVGMTFALSHVYAAKGAFTVTVTVTDDDAGADTAETQVAVANRAPLADAGPPAQGREGGEVAFDGQASSDPDGDVLTFTWDFGDGSAPAFGPSATHTYADNGTYAVQLSVSDGSLTSTAATTAEIANVAPVVSDLASRTIFSGQTYDAAGSFSDPGADSWSGTVDYGDGSGVHPLALPGEQFVLSHVYAEAGTFTVTVVVADDDGGAGSARAQVQVVSSNRAPIADAGPALRTGNEGAALGFDGRASSDPDGDALTFAWDFGDGAAATGPTATHAYADNGEFTVVLTVSDGRLSGTATVMVHVTNIAPAVTVSGSSDLLLGQGFQGGGSFTDPGADTWTATVDYGDGSGVQLLALSGNTFTLAHAYAASGTYTVTVVVRDDDGGLGTGGTSVAVQSPEQAVGDVEQAIADLQSSGVLSPPNANNLVASLDAAIAKLSRGDYAGAKSALETFIGKVEGMLKNGRLTAVEGQPLIDAANAIIAAINAA
jgi:PKD repeat protein